MKTMRLAAAVLGQVDEPGAPPSPASSRAQGEGADQDQRQQRPARRRRLGPPPRQLAADLGPQRQRPARSGRLRPLATGSAAARPGAPISS